MVDGKVLQEILETTQKVDVLFVEDDEKVRDVIRETLSFFFRRVYLAENGEEGLRIFQQYSPKVVVTDILMPRLNGLEMSKEMKLNDPSVKILVMTAYDEPAYFLDAIEIGVDGFILKPITEQKLINTFKKLVHNLKVEEERRQNYNLLTQYKEMIEKGAVYATFTPDGLFKWVNSEFTRITGYKYEELIGKPFHSVKQPNDLNKFQNLMETIRIKRDIWQGILKLRSKKGDNIYLRATIKPILDEGQILEFAALAFNVSEIMNPRRLLIDFLKDVEVPLVTIVEIENYEDLLSYFLDPTIQELERSIYRFISIHFPDGKVFNLSKLQFVIVVPLLKVEKEEQEIIGELQQLQRAIEQETFRVNDIDYQLTTLFSIGMGKNGYDDARLGLKKLKQDKAKFIVADNLSAKERIRAERNLQILRILKESVENNGIICYGQPIIDNRFERLDKMELLVRINYRGEILTPFTFLSIARNTSYYAKIAPIVLETAIKLLECRQDCEVSINISSLDLEKKHIRDQLFKLLDRNRKNLNRLIFELLEDEEVTCYNDVHNFIREIKEYGAKLAIDDFGSGYSNFKRILTYRPDYIKIDGSLIKNIHRDPFSRKMVKSIVEFARNVEIKTVAEFVENEEIFKVVKELGIDYSQGYYFGKPTPIEGCLEKEIDGIISKTKSRTVGGGNRTH